MSWHNVLRYLQLVGLVVIRCDCGVAQEIQDVLEGNVDAPQLLFSATCFLFWSCDDVCSKFTPISIFEFLRVTLNTFSHEMCFKLLITLC